MGSQLRSVYDPEANSWEQVAGMPTPRANAEVALLDETIPCLWGL